MPQQYDDFDDEDDEQDGILQDGQTLHVPLTMLDSVQQQVGLVLHDGFGQPVGNKPGYVFLANDRHIYRATIWVRTAAIRI